MGPWVNSNNTWILSLVIQGDENKKHICNIIFMNQGEHVNILNTIIMGNL